MTKRTSSLPCHSRPRDDLGASKSIERARRVEPGLKVVPAAVVGDRIGRNRCRPNVSLLITAHGARAAAVRFH